MPLSKSEIALVKGMLLRNDKQSDIAAWFGVNSGRIAEINTGQRWAEIAAASPSDLPPKGPYFVSARANILAKDTLSAVRSIIDRTLEQIDNYTRSAHD